MTSRARLLATVLSLAPMAFACGKNEEQVQAQAASPTPRVVATQAPAVASSATPATTTTTQPAGTLMPAPTQAAQPPAPPPPTSAPPTTTQAEKPAAPQPAAPALPAAQPPKGKITLPAKLGAVTFDHENHAGKLAVACATCHHPSQPQRPLAAEHQACRDCHKMPAALAMKTSLQAAFHDSKGAAGTCIDCHKQKGGKAPVKCLECHRKK